MASSAVKPPYEITPEQGLKNKLKGKINFTKDPKSADVVLLFVGLNHDKEGGRKEFITGFFSKKKKEMEVGNDTEGADRNQLELPKDQVNLILETIKVNPNTGLNYYGDFRLTISSTFSLFLGVC